MTRKIKHQIPGSVFLTIFILLALLTACDLVRPGPTPTVTLRPLISPSATLEMIPTITPTPDRLQGTVILWHAWDESNQPILEAILDAFQAQYPDVFFDVTYVPLENLKARFELEAREGGGPTVLFGPAEWGPEFYTAGLVPDLSPIVAPAVWEGLPAAALGNVQYNESLVGLPYQMRGVVLYRNRDLAQLPPETYDQMVGRAQGLTQGEVVGAYLDRSFYYSGGHLLGLGGSFIHEDGTPAFNSEQGLLWLSLLQSYTDLGPTSFLDDEDLRVFIEGRVGWIIAGSWRLSEIVAALGEDRVGIDPWPLYREGRLAGFVQTENLYLTVRAASAETLGARAGGDPQAASLAFAEFMLSPDAQALFAQAGLIPVDSEAVSANRLVEQTYAALSGGTAYPIHPDFDLYPTVLDAALQSVFSGEAAPEQALLDAEALILQSLNPALVGEEETTSTPAP